MRQIRIKNLALDKEHNLRLQAERERDQAIKEKTKLANLIRKLLTIIFNLRKETTKIRGE